MSYRIIRGELGRGFGDRSTYCQVEQVSKDRKFLWELVFLKGEILVLIEDERQG